MFDKGTWLNPPPDWSIDTNGVLNARSAGKTDFWRRTHYGFERDNGHALLLPADAEFSAALTFSGDYHTLYDQAGLMIRASAERWIKFGIELTDGATHLSVVVTDGSSDWSARIIALDGPLTIRATRIGDAVFMQLGGADGAWSMVRLAPFAADADAAVGPYFCSPERAGFKASFHSFALTEPLVRGVH
ncbi:DUF1349 domain-containing protein [Acuticoccus sp. MNP-M23]|uniref:DUF1349 domain-containing protein n=1 Tax=Acuticoccus sp. MNP-M23 TaxID=3072793 RepID=UPI00281594F2|nr:DUF1349 domain-containing protein [Acuticoccus sp. MNP-M23]WMS42395.1 DUF1349 domain-containing protein [Acuticoccus sp. MNP-M23]